MVPMAIAGIIAVVDWWVVADRQADRLGRSDGGLNRRDIERWAKPAVMVFLIIAAVLIPAESDWIRWWIVIGLGFGLVGDVLLFQDRFIPGAAAFLIGHVAYIVALVPIEHPMPAVILGLVIVGAFAVSLGRCIVRGAWRQSTVLGSIVVAYMVTIGAVVVLAVGSWSTVAGIAALLFMASDTLLAWARFVGSAPGGRVTVMVTYQLAQAGFVLAIPTLVI
ncbi:MAG: lysoplasmalogenase [Candidatus Nanopelagicales bacterium]